MEENKSLARIVSNELVHKGTDTGIDLAEITIDSFFESGILQGIPFVKSVHALVNIGLGIREKVFMRNTLNFLHEFHLGKISEERLHAFRTKMKGDEKYRAKVTEHTIIYNDRFEEVEKLKYSLAF